jgi:hypothetical protein
MPSILPDFGQMWNLYPTEEKSNLFESIGWSDVLNNPNYLNTCSVRMSICLIRCGIHLPAWASDNIHNPKHQYNKARIIPEHEKLSRYLEHLWGPPEKFINGEKENLPQKSGVISFFKIQGYYLNGQDSRSLGGHIDLVTRDEKTREINCRGHKEGYWDLSEFWWFWPAPKKGK